MLGERAGFQTDSLRSITKGFSPALCFLLAVKAAPTWPVEQLCPVAFLSALLWSVLLASFQYWLLTSTHLNELLTGKTIWQWFHSHKTLPNSNKMRLQFSCCVHNLAQSFVFSLCGVWSGCVLSLSHQGFTLPSAISTQKPKLLPFNPGMEAELDNQKAKMGFHLSPTASSADDQLGPVFSWKLARSWAIPEACGICGNLGEDEQHSPWVSRLLNCSQVHCLTAGDSCSLCILPALSSSVHNLLPPQLCQHCSTWSSPAWFCQNDLGQLKHFQESVLKPNQNILTELGWGVRMGHVPVRLERRQVRVRGDPAVMVS